MNRSSVRISMVAALAAVLGCENSVNDAGDGPEEQLTPADVVGTYDLVRVDNQSLPANTGRVTYFNGQYVLSANGQFSLGQLAELCLLGTCQTQGDTLAGTWTVTWDGKVYFDLRNGSSWTMDADGEVMVRCPSGSTCAPKLEYQKH